MDTETKDIIQNTTCFATHKAHNVCCNKTTCKNWIKSSENCNCCINAVKHGAVSLDAIGAMFSLTRMRICQIEKEARNKIIKYII